MMAREVAGLRAAFGSDFFPMNSDRILAQLLLVRPQNSRIVWSALKRILRAQMKGT